MRRQLGLRCCGWVSGLISLTVAVSGCDERDDGDAASGPSSPIGADSNADDHDTDGATGSTGETDTSEDSGPEDDATSESDPSAGSTTTGPSETCEVQGGARPCSEPDAQQYCDDGVWGACVVPQCELGATVSCEFGVGHDTCVLIDATPMWQCDGDPAACACEDDGGTSTPIVLSFDGAEPRLTAGATAVFDNELTGDCLATDWPTVDTPWLALDRDGDGTIVDGRELFGSGTRLHAGATAQHGFAALRELDANGDGRLTPADPRFGELVLWSDHDGDRRGLAGELLPLSSFGVLSIELGYARASLCDTRGNCGVERASFTFVAPGGALQHGQAIDLHLACQ